MAFSASDAAFEGFRVVRRHPFALVFWALLYVVVFGVAFALVGGNMVTLIAAMARLETMGGTPTLEDLQPVIQTYLTMLVVLVPLFLVASAVLTSAISRAVLRPGTSAFGYMRLGADEIRVLVVTIAVGFVMVALMALFGLLIGVAYGATSGTSAGGLIVAVLCVAALGAYIWLMVRLSLAVPITIAERRIAVFDSFRMTKGHFWSLLGMALLAGVMSVVVSILGSIVTMPIQMMTGGGFKALEGMDGGNMMAMLQAAWPAILVMVVLQAVLSALQLAVIYAPFSAAYRDITGGKPDADVFA